ncbi:MAG: hypothetical protein KAT16_08830, partial [Candidatus Heimdallarchaeota archaeon]|nr:hypothetical protein [Candidatus Heimdallarchaeota archaeon]
MQKNIKFLTFIDSITPLISSFLLNVVFLQENSSRDYFDLVFNSFKAKSEDKEIPYHIGISKVLAALIYDYFYIGIVTLRDNHKALEIVTQIQEKIVLDTRIQSKDLSISSAKSFLNELITLIQERNTEIPFFHNSILPMKQILSSLLEDNQISMELYEFFIQNFTHPIFYNQMKTPHYFELGIPWEHKQKFGQVF